MPFMSVKNRRGLASRRRFFISTAIILRPSFTVTPRRGRKQRILFVVLISFSPIETSLSSCILAFTATR